MNAFTSNIEFRSNRPARRLPIRLEALLDLSSPASARSYKTLEALAGIFGEHELDVSVVILPRLENNVSILLAQVIGYFSYSTRSCKPPPISVSHPFCVYTVTVLANARS